MMTFKINFASKYEYSESKSVYKKYSGSILHVQNKMRIYDKEKAVI
jgi:hypothetical protein